MTDNIDDVKFHAAIDMLRHTGLDEIRIHNTEEEQPPVCWVAQGKWPEDRWECAAAMNPLYALFRLCEQVMDGGQCTHCNRPTGFSETSNTLLMNKLICWYQWDFESLTFQRGCKATHE